MVFDTFRVETRRFGRNPQCQQETFDDPVLAAADGRPGHVQHRAGCLGGRLGGAFGGVVVLCDLAEGGRVVGTSMIHAQHGTPEAPHVWFDVTTEERCSAGLGRRFSHQVLRIGYTFDGPSELGGLILLPAYRGGGRRAGSSAASSSSSSYGRGQRRANG